MDREITDKTKISISILSTLAALAFSIGVAWAQISEVKTKQEIYTQTLQNIDRRLSNIEGKLGVNSQ